MVPKPFQAAIQIVSSFRAVLFRMVPKLRVIMELPPQGFRAVLFRMVPKRLVGVLIILMSFRAVLFRMVPKLEHHGVRP